MFKEVSHCRSGRKVVLATTVFFLVFFTGVTAAKAPEPDLDKGVPQYIAKEFEIVKEMLQENSDKMDVLSVQLALVEAALKDEINTAKGEIRGDIATATADIRADLVLLDEDLDKALAILEAPDQDIQLTTEVCFDLGASWDWAYTGKLAGGIGIEAGLSGEAQLELSMPGLLPLPIPAPAPVMVPIMPGVSAGVGGTVCLTVPLYALASNDHWIEDFDTSEFDALISSIAMPAQFLLPGLAHAYGQVMPDPEDTMSMVSDGLAAVDPDSASAAKTVMMTRGINSGSVAYSKGLSPEQMVYTAALASHEDMMLGSPLMRKITEQNSIGDAFANPCTIAQAFDLPAADAIAAGCTSAVDIFLDIIDPFCVLDVLRVGHCKP